MKTRTGPLGQWTASLLLLMLCSRCHAEPPAPQEQPELPEVMIKLLAPTSEITGMEVRKPVPGRRVLSGYMLKPHRLTLVMPDGKSVSMVVANMTWGSKDGIVYSVYVRRPLDRVAFGAAVDDLRMTLKELGIEPSEELKQDLANLPDHVLGREDKWGLPHNFRVGMGYKNLLWNSVSLLIDISPDSREGWYYLMDFSVDHDFRQVVKTTRDWETYNVKRLKEPARSLWIGQHITQMDLGGWDTDPFNGETDRTRYIHRGSIEYFEEPVERFHRPRRFRVPIIDGHLVQTDHRISEIRFIPLWKLAPMSDVLKQLRTSLDEWKVELPDETEAEMARWAEQPAIPKDYTWTGYASAPLNDKSTLHWSIHPIPGWGWFVRMRIAPPEQQ